MNVLTIPIANNSHGGGRFVPNTSIATLPTNLCAKTFAKLELDDHPFSSSRFSTVTTTCSATTPATTKTPTAMIVTPILPLLRSVISEEDEHHERRNRLDQQCLSSAIAARSSQDSKKRKKTVRFSSTTTEATMESSSNEVEDADACRKKRRRNQLETETSSHKVASASAAPVSSPSSSSSSAPLTTASASTTPPPPPLWYTPTELRSIQRSLIRAVRSYDRNSNKSIATNTDQDDEEDAHVLEYYSTRKRYERRNKRDRMLKTCRAVQEFEATIQTQVPLTELLSQLLHRYSSSSSS